MFWGVATHNFFLIFQIVYSYLVNSKILGAMAANVGPDHNRDVDPVVANIKKRLLKFRR